MKNSYWLLSVLAISIPLLLLGCPTDDDDAVDDDTGDDDTGDDDTGDDDTGDDDTGDDDTGDDDTVDDVAGAVDFGETVLSDPIRSGPPTAVNETSVDASGWHGSITVDSGATYDVVAPRSGPLLPTLTRPVVILEAGTTRIPATFHPNTVATIHDSMYNAVAEVAVDEDGVLLESLALTPGDGATAGYMVELLNMVVTDGQDMITLAHSEGRIEVAVDGDGRAYGSFPESVTASIPSAYPLTTTEGFVEVILPAEMIGETHSLDLWMDSLGVVSQQEATVTSTTVGGEERGLLRIELDAYETFFGARISDAISSLFGEEGEAATTETRFGIDSCLGD